MPTERFQTAMRQICGLALLSKFTFFKTHFFFLPFSFFFSFQDTLDFYSAFLLDSGLFVLQTTNSSSTGSPG